MTARATCLLAVSLLAGAAPAALARELVFSDSLREGGRVAGAAYENRGGEWTADGWRMEARRGFLRISLPEPTPRDGELEVRIARVDWAAIGRAIGADRKIHFLSLFSNPVGDHHAEGGGTPADALWTLRAGTDEDSGIRYGGALKLLWASRGAKRTVGSDYHEKQVRSLEGWRWDPAKEHLFVVRWSARERTLRVRVDGREAIAVPWEHEGDPLRHVFLGGAADFAAMSGAVFSDLRIYRIPENTRR